MYVVMYESSISKKTGISLSILGCLAAVIQFGLYWMVGNNVTAFQRACLRPNDIYEFPNDVVYVGLGSSIVVYNTIGLGICIKLFMWLRKEEKDSRLRNRQRLQVS